MSADHDSSSVLWCRNENTARRKKQLAVEGEEEYSIVLKEIVDTEAEVYKNSRPELPPNESYPWTDIANSLDGKYLGRVEQMRIMQLTGRYDINQVLALVADVEHPCGIKLEAITSPSQPLRFKWKAV